MERNRKWGELKEVKPHLFDTVRVDCGLWLKYTNWLCFLSALRHLPHLLRDEVMDAIQRLYSALDQADTLCCS